MNQLGISIAIHLTVNEMMLIRRVFDPLADFRPTVTGFKVLLGCYDRCRK